MVETNREMTCNLIEGALREALDNLEEARECMTGWNWTYISPEDVDETIETLRKIVDNVTLELESNR